MFPSLLAQHPDLADAMETYRQQRLPEAKQHATATGHKGARFPWESALNGTEQIPPPVSINSEGSTSSTSPPISRSRSGSTTRRAAT